ncbi:hypothetical protein [Candidatus Methylacidithermus pantelleriae]|uniref:Uncharacterized protein n=1 Tax=Candidatus Methylacidithermus pantelleriae TaxID=2744239 RepID=A0A8J2FRV4_9BACT|nr:hypothetical protein [Candidatus Methylacidithermus pantelleriae]CAF0691375.1 hypothetical protein MPNT_100025 [Candidatus Methylacidithermus pantelleriae]
MASRSGGASSLVLGSKERTARPGPGKPRYPSTGVYRLLRLRLRDGRASPSQYVVFKGRALALRRGGDPPGAPRRQADRQQDNQDRGELVWKRGDPR